MMQKLDYATRRAKSGPIWWLPRRWAISLAALFCVLIGITFLIYALVRSREALTLHLLAEADAIAFTKRLQSDVDNQLRAFRRLKWNYIAGRYRKPCELEAASLEVQ